MAVPAWPSSQSANRPAVAAIRSGVRPVTSRVLTGGSGSAGAGFGAASVTGACSMSTWALVPLTPNDDTAARRGRLTSGHCIGAAAMTNFEAPGPACGVSLVKCNCWGMCPRATLKTVLMKPATPAADSR